MHYGIPLLGVGAVDFDDFMRWARKNVKTVAQLASHLNVPFPVPKHGNGGAGRQTRASYSPPVLPVVSPTRAATVITDARSPSTAVPRASNPIGDRMGMVAQQQTATAVGRAGANKPPPVLLSVSSTHAASVAPGGATADVDVCAAAPEASTHGAPMSMISTQPGPLVATAARLPSAGVTGASNAIEERMRLMAQRRKAKARGLGDTS